jgi:hypothetical protein
MIISYLTHFVTQSTYQPSYLERVGGSKGFVEAFYACAALLYRLTSIPMAAGCLPKIQAGGVIIALLGNFMPDNGESSLLYFTHSGATVRKRIYSAILTIQAIVSRVSIYIALCWVVQPYMILLLTDVPDVRSPAEGTRPCRGQYGPAARQLRRHLRRYHSGRASALYSVL